MIKKGLERAKTFDWDNFSEKTLKVYEELIAKDKN
jgi:glycosyltransferase involved in cell wall biosynthesis